MVYCPGKEDMAEQTFFEYDTWTVIKLELETNIGQITPENVISLMLRSRYVEFLLRRKQPGVQGIG